MTTPGDQRNRPDLRDRHGRGMRGPAIRPEQPGRPEVPTDRERFDRLVVELVGELEQKWHDRLGLVEYAVEDAPAIPDDWDQPTVPLSSLIRGSGVTPTRIVVFRRPIERRCPSRPELAAMVLTVLVEQVAELLGVPPEQVDARYGRD